MATRKTIELNFSDENNSVNYNETSSGSSNSDVKILNFGGLIIEVKETKKSAAKPAPIHLSFDGSDENQPPEDENVSPKNKNEPQLKTIKPQASGTDHDLDDFVVITKPTPVIPLKPRHLKSNPVQPKQVLSLPPEVQAEDEVNGAAGLWAQDKVQEQKVEAPPVTEEDWKIFKQFMDPLKPPQEEVKCYDLLVERNKVKLNKNNDEFVCPKCENFLQKGKGVVLKNCLHNFCRVCLIDAIHNSHDENGEVKCPMTLEACEHIIDDEEVKELLGDSYAPFITNIYQMLSVKYAEKEREEEAEKYATLPAMLNADNFDIIENFEVFECTVCMSEVAISEGIILKDCLHKFCKECLIGQVTYSEDFVVKCPNVDDDGSCKFAIQEREIRKLVPADVFEKHLEKSLKQYQGASETAYHCKTPDCSGFVEIDENVRGFTCQVCDKVNCIGCKAIHQGMNCQEYEFQKNPDGAHQRANAESEIAIKKMIEDGDAMFCPKCGIPVVKADGCDFITCTTCRLGICWRTKKPRQPITKANGEVVDGCHCMERGVRCHPQCGNCH